jgi:drug/metabolite transporter (DMT)-like permease
MTSRSLAGGALPGILCIVGAWFLFSLHDAAIKLLVADLSAWQVLCVRSAMLLPLCLAIGGRRCLAGLTTSPVRGQLVLGAVVYALAWVAYYAAARYLQLAELETIYYVSPLLTTALAVLLLKERVPLPRWAALLVGFAGVVLACRPSAVQGMGPVALVLLGAGLWALAVVMIRHIGAAVSTEAQMFLNGIVSLVLCAVSVPWWWTLPTLRELGLMTLVGGAGFVAQYLLYEGIRRAPASVAAPLEYTGLLWAFALGFVIWGDVPADGVFWGAALIMASGLVLIAMEWRQARVVDAATGATERVPRAAAAAS